MIGSFVVSGIVLVVVAVVVFGSGHFLDKRTRFVAFFPGSVNGLAVGSNVAFRGVNVGNVTQILLSMGSDSVDLADSRVPVIFEVDENLIQARGAAVDLDDADQVREMLDQGMSARLDTESLLTGRLYVSLDFRPEADLLTFGGDYPYIEVPTVASSLAQAQAKMRELADRFAEVDLEAVFHGLRSTLDGANSLINDPELQRLSSNLNVLVAELDETATSVRRLAETVDTTVGPIQVELTAVVDRAESSMQEVDETLRAMQSVVHPEAPVVVGLVETLEELQLAARSLRRVAELVERDPSILVRGRAGGGGS
jgi:paraquat-inducible protein B